MLASRAQIAAFYGITLSFAAVATQFFVDFPVLLAIPLVLGILYMAIFHLNRLFELVVVCTPISLNLEDLEIGGIGFYFPTEPLLFGMLLLLVMRNLTTERLNRNVLLHPVTIGFGAYFLWLFVTTITSSDIIVSAKFVLSKLWFVVPVFFFGMTYFKKRENIKRFLWLYVLSLSVAVLFTLVRHAIWGFGEEAGHWVMSPFFKDHTSYGAVLALLFPPLIGLFILEKDQIRKLFVGGLVLLHLLGIVFSYTRAAYVSLVAAFLVYLVMRWRIKFKYLFVVGLVSLTLVIWNYDSIMMRLQKNKIEHTSEDFGERLQSISNISTDASNLERFNRWNSAIEMFKQRPVFGFGPGTYMFQYAPFQHPDDKTIISTNFGTGGNAHSEYLGPLSEGGILGMLTVIFLVATILYTGITLYFKLEDPELKMIVLMVVLGLITYFIHGVLNNYLDTDKASVPVWGFAAIIVAIDLHHRNEKA